MWNKYFLPSSRHTCFSTTLYWRHILFTLFLLWPFQASAQWQSDAFIGLTSNYIYRGYSLGGDEPAPRANWSASNDAGLFVNVWLSKDDIAGLKGEEHGRDWETEWSVGKSWQISEEWSVAGAFAWFEYFRDNQPRDHDYSEYRLSFHYSDHLSLNFASTSSLWGNGIDSYYAALVKRFSGPHRSLIEVEFGGVSINASPIAVEYPYLRTSVGFIVAEDWSAAVEYSYSGKQAFDLFNSDRIGSQLSFSITRHFSF